MVGPTVYKRIHLKKKDWDGRPPPSPIAHIAPGTRAASLPKGEGDFLQSLLQLLQLLVHT